MKNNKILYVYRTKRRPILKNWQKGKGPDSLLFGANHLKKMGYCVDIFDESYALLNPLHPLFYPLEHLIINKVGMGFKLDQAVTLLPKFNNYDVIVATGDSAGLPILYLKYLHLIKKPVIFMTAGLAGALKGKSKTWVGSLYKKILPCADIFTSYSKIEIDFFVSEMGIKKGKIKYLPLATDWEYFSQKSKAKREVICAVGTELGRDYKTFFDAVKNLPVKAEIACHPDNIKGLQIPSNVKVHLNIPVSKVRKLYQRSIISVVPCKERYRSSGQMVVLESSAAGLPTIASKIFGITSAFTFENNKNILFFKPEDSIDLRKKIKFLLGNKNRAEQLGLNASKKCRLDYTTQKMAQTLEKFIHNL